MPFCKTTSQPLDLLVVGLGPAGVSTLLQARREGISLLGVSDQPIGGLVRAARRLDNLPGRPGISGISLAKEMEKQIRQLAIPTLFDSVINLRRKRNLWQAALQNGGFVQARAVVLATGTVPVPWEFSFAEVHRDVTGLPNKLSGKKVIVVGGGEAALDSALNCKDRGAQVTVLARGGSLRCADALQQEAINCWLDIRKKIKVRTVFKENEMFILSTNREQFSCHYLLVCIGRQPRRELLECIGTDDTEELKKVGIFLAGDLVRGHERYAATAMGDGQRAALEAMKFLRR